MGLRFLYFIIQPFKKCSNLFDCGENVHTLHRGPLRVWPSRAKYRERIYTTTVRRWPSVASHGSMLLLALLSYLAYLIVTLQGRANSQFFLTLLPLTSSALIAGMYILTAPHLSLKPQHRVALISLIVVVSLSLLSLFLFGLRTA